MLPIIELYRNHFNCLINVFGRTSKRTTLQYFDIVCFREHHNSTCLAWFCCRESYNLTKSRFVLECYFALVWVTVKYPLEHNILFLYSNLVLEIERNQKPNLHCFLNCFFWLTISYSLSSVCLQQLFVDSSGKFVLEVG